MQEFDHHLLEYNVERVSLECIVSKSERILFRLLTQRVSLFFFFFLGRVKIKQIVCFFLSNFFTSKLLKSMANVPIVDFNCCLFKRNPFSESIRVGEFSQEFIRKRKQTIEKGDLKAKVSSWSKLTSLDTLVNSIKNYSDELDRLWLIFYWISQNISYEKQRGIDNHSAQSVFHHRKAICEGYSTLFEYLSNHVGIRCLKIHGFSKSTDQNEQDQSAFNRSNSHAWNSIQWSDKSWYLLDSTWGAGHLSSKHFVQKLDTYYFLTRPEQLVYTHFPSDSKWQLLPRNQQISSRQFANQPKVWSTFFSAELEIIEPKSSSELKFDKQSGFISALIRAPKHVLINSSMQTKNRTCPSEQCLVNYLHDKQLWQCLFICKQRGRHAMTIFTRFDKSKQKKSRSAVEFYFNGKSNPQKSFPQTYGSFQTLKCQLIEPLTGQLRKGTQVTIHCRIENVENVALQLDNNTWIHDGYDRSTGSFRKTITVPFKQITLNAKENKRDKDQYSVLALFTVVS